MAIADRRGAGLGLLSGAVAGLSFGIAERVLALRLSASGHGLSSVTQRHAGASGGEASAAQVVLAGSAAALAGRPRRRGIGKSGRGAGAWCLRQQGGMLAHPVARALDLHDDSVVQQPVQQGGGDDGIAENFAPFRKAAVGG